MRIIRILCLLSFLTSALAQVQTTGTVSLTGTVQLMTGGKHSVSLAWQAAQGQYITFRVYRSTTSGSGYKMIQSSISGLSYTDANVNDSTTYYYVATAYDSSTNSESAYSNQIIANIPN
jgi:fibronectin type 3 domain-containing protein